MMIRIAVIHYSATGNVHRLAEAVADGARDEGAEVRVRRVAELAPAQAVAANRRWAAHAGGNPYGAAFASNGHRAELASVLRAAHHQGARLARYAAAIRSLRREPALVDA